MDKALFLFLLLVCSTYAQFFSPGARPGPFSGPPQPPRQGPFFQRPQQQPGILRQLANLFGLDGRPSTDALPPSIPGIRGPGGPRPVPTNQQFFRPDAPLPPDRQIPGQRNPQPPAIIEGFELPPRNFQRPSQGPRQQQPQPFAGIQQQSPQGSRIPLGSTQILTFQPEDVRSGFENVPTSSGNPPGPVSAGFLQQQSASRGTPIRPSEPLLTQPIATQFSNDLGSLLQSSGAPQATFPQFPQAQQETPIELVSAPSLKQTTTLKDILKEDCEDFDERGYCDSSRRYPTLQIADLVKRCSSILDALYVPVPESNDISSTQLRKDKKEGNSLRNIERANQAVWSWAKYAAEKSSVCKSDMRRVTPSYARDISQKWVVVLQNIASNMIQHVTMDKCDDVNKECLSGPEGDRHPGTRCTQRYTHHHLVTWDPDKPHECPSLRAFSFPTACLCHFSPSSFFN